LAARSRAVVIFFGHSRTCYATLWSD